MAFPRRLAAHGLDKNPIQQKGMARSDTEIWPSTAHYRATASDARSARTGSFSASTVPKEAFLTIRCIWPAKKRPKDASTYIANLEYFFNEDHSGDATKLTETSLASIN
ncbi:predicted protein [Histoplasma capsulatum G186AR]|uniref:Uncharacterized protein n=1 Tax=Ajellomyces capsulatus (strain G186AR / H82 / ATCC MYA-2454 / RMSCC 2432) TaxID=447093 RepID=C0NT02_AJECG|nr:uncharacterized protein HCBG_06282 [Histoplasma capsulatum G186AR]EEH05163.1 predicted protein [Histoplasma capsulatum G186AR]